MTVTLTEERFLALIKQRSFLFQEHQLCITNFNAFFRSPRWDEKFKTLQSLLGFHNLAYFSKEHQRSPTLSSFENRIDKVDLSTLLNVGKCISCILCMATVILITSYIVRFYEQVSQITSRDLTNRDVRSTAYRNGLRFSRVAFYY